jgi:hypothetical protein
MSTCVYFRDRVSMTARFVPKLGERTVLLSLNIITIQGDRMSGGADAVTSFAHLIAT